LPKPPTININSNINELYKQRYERGICPDPAILWDLRKMAPRPLPLYQSEKSVPEMGRRDSENEKLPQGKVRPGDGREKNQRLFICNIKNSAILLS
jgi:hypothetical protein